MNLSKLPNLEAFSLSPVVCCKPPRKRNAPWSAPPFAALHDINIVLGTIPESNRLTNLWFHIVIMGVRPFRGCLDQDWVGTFKEVIRIGGGKPLELEFGMSVSTEDSYETEHPGEDELYRRIMEKTELLSDYPNICTHWWNSTFRNRGINPFPSGQVRTRCRR